MFSSMLKVAMGSYADRFKIISRNFKGTRIKMQFTYKVKRGPVFTDIIVKRSRKRKKTIQGYVRNGVITIQVSFGLEPAEEKTQVDKIVRRLERMVNRRQEKDEEYLRRLFEKFNREFFDRSLTVNSIIFVNNQNVINGSCTPADRTIRISDRILQMPPWVLNYVVLHEMAHLFHPDHSKAFWGIVNRYRYTERARSYLIARGMEKD